MIINTEHVNKTYGNVSIIRDLNLSVPEGSAYALVGTNGAGKTTTIRTLLNIISPDSGTVNILGVDSRALSYIDLEKIGYVSENQKLPERLTIGEFFKYLSGLYPTWDRALEKELIEKLDLPVDRKLGKLSHGMRMKTVLIAGISFRPKLLILDEPLSGMDSLTRDEVVEGMLSQAHETTILISSHELAEIENFTTDVAFMDSGNLLFQESTESLKSRFRNIQVVLSSIKTLPDQVPENWLFPQISGHLLSFIDSDFKEREVLYQQLSEHFGAISFEEEAMTLRHISTALIRQSREIRRGATQ